MKSLKELVENYNGFLADQEIIVRYFVDNDMEDQALELITKISKAKLQKISWRLGYAVSWGSIITMNLDYSQKSFGENTADMLTLQLWFIHHAEPKPTGFDRVEPTINDKDLEFADGIQKILEKIPTIQFPKGGMFFKPCLDWLHNKGIYFKNEVKE